jgi:hypothetical protein
MYAEILHDDHHRLLVRKGVFVGAFRRQGIIDIRQGDDWWCYDGSSYTCGLSGTLGA